MFHFCFGEALAQERVGADCTRTVKMERSHLNYVMVLISCLICLLSSVNENRLTADYTTGFRHGSLIINYGRRCIIMCVCVCVRVLLLWALSGPVVLVGTVAWS